MFMVSSKRARVVLIQVHLDSEEKNRNNIKTTRSHRNVTYRSTPRTQTPLGGVTRFGTEMTYKQGNLKGILRLEYKLVVGSAWGKCAYIHNTINAMQEDYASNRRLNMMHMDHAMPICGKNKHQCLIRWLTLDTQKQCSGGELLLN